MSYQRHPISSVISGALSPVSYASRPRHQRPPNRGLVTRHLYTSCTPPTDLSSPNASYSSPPLSRVLRAAGVANFTFLVSCQEDRRAPHITPLALPPPHLSHPPPRPLSLLLCLVLQDAGVGELTEFTLMDATLGQSCRYLLEALSTLDKKIAGVGGDRASEGGERVRDGGERERDGGERARDGGDV